MEDREKFYRFIQSVKLFPIIEKYISLVVIVATGKNGTHVRPWLKKETVLS